MHLSAQQVEAVLSPAQANAIVREAMLVLSAGQTRQLPRGILHLDQDRFYGAMTGSLWSGQEQGLEVFGSKLVSVFPAVAGQGHASHQGLIVLFDGHNGQPIATIDAGSVTALRTAAASAVATDALARPDARNLSLLGCGEQAWRHALAIDEVRPLQSVRIWGRSQAKAAALAERLRPRMDAAIHTCKHVRQAVQGSDIVCCLTSAKDAYLFGRDLEPGMHLNLVGSSFLGPVEVDNEVVCRSRFIVDSLESARLQAAEFHNALKAGVVDKSHMVGEIGQVLNGGITGREHPEQITVYKSLGHIVQDLASALWLYRELSG